MAFQKNTRKSRNNIESKISATVWKNWKYSLSEKPDNYHIRIWRKPEHIVELPKGEKMPSYTYKRQIAFNYLHNLMSG